MIVGCNADDGAESQPSPEKMNYGSARRSAKMCRRVCIWGIPASFIISKDGKVCRKHLGIAPKNVFEKEIVALM